MMSFFNKKKKENSTIPAKEKAQTTIGSQSKKVTAPVTTKKEPLIPTGTAKKTPSTAGTVKKTVVPAGQKGVLLPADTPEVKAAKAKAEAEAERAYLTDTALPIESDASTFEPYQPEVINTAEIGTTVPVVGGIIKKYIPPKPLVDKKLTIILLENTAQTMKEKDMLAKIIKSVAPSGLLTIIAYDSKVVQNEIEDASKLENYDEFLSLENVGNIRCLYDALIEMEALVEKRYMRTEENERSRVRIKDIDVIGIGTCKDNCSVALKKDAIEAFYKVNRKPAVTTKYFCLTEADFLDAAEVGFRSIGAIFRNYQ